MIKSNLVHKNGMIVTSRTMSNIKSNTKRDFLRSGGIRFIENFIWTSIQFHPRCKNDVNQ